MIDSLKPRDVCPCGTARIERSRYANDLGGPRREQRPGRPERVAMPTEDEACAVLVGIAEEDVMVIDRFMTVSRQYLLVAAVPVMRSKVPQ